LGAAARLDAGTAEVNIEGALVAAGGDYDIVTTAEAGRAERGV